MKKQIILLASLLVLSIPALAQSEWTETIACSGATAKIVVKDMADDKNPDDFSAGLKAAGKELAVNFANLINSEAHSGKADLLEVQEMVLKAACIKELSKDKPLSDRLNTKYKELAVTVKGRAKSYLYSLPPQISGSTITSVDVNNIMYYNNDSVAFILAVFVD